MAKNRVVGETSGKIIDLIFWMLEAPSKSLTSNHSGDIFDKASE